MGETILYGLEEYEYSNYIDRYDVLRRQQQGMEDVLFGSLEGPGRLSPLRQSILGWRSIYLNKSCQLRRYAPPGDTASSIEFAPTASPVMGVTENDDLSGTILEKTLPFLHMDLAVTEETVPSSLMTCCCGSSSTFLLVQQGTVVENITGNVAITPAISGEYEPETNC